MDKKRLTSVYNRICAFNRSEVKDKEYPWLDEVQMTDEELAERLTHDVGIRTSNTWMNNGFKKPYDRICINILKSFYETGEHHLVNDGYINGQLENVIERIKDPGM